MELLDADVEVPAMKMTLAEYQEILMRLAAEASSVVIPLTATRY